MMIAPTDKIRPFPIKPSTDNVVDRALHGMLDTDGNGKVSKDEWKKSGRDAESFKMHDANGDGTISEQEFTQTRQFEREFNAKDWSGDGALSRFEFEGRKLFGSIGGGVLKNFEKADKAIGGAVEGAKDMMLRCMPPILRDRFAQFDQDGDGKVSKAEYVEGRRNETNRIDWNHIRPLPMPMPHKLPLEKVVSMGDEYSVSHKAAANG
jgi:Ca2+-binding EF-hand superfamily protein